MMKNTTQTELPGSDNKCYNVFQINEIDPDRLVVVLDQPIDNHNFASYQHTVTQELEAPMTDGTYYGWPRKEIIITDRRVPFQQRSVCCKRVVSAVLYSDKFVFNTNGNYGCDVGDYIYPIIQNLVVDEPYLVTAVNMFQNNSSIEIGPEFGITAAGLLMALNAHAGNLGHYGFFIHRRGTERLRWTRDAKNLKYAPTTFNYQFHQYNPHGTGAASS